jgi:hypothetical protein
VSVKGEAGLAFAAALKSGDGEAIADAFSALKDACGYEEEAPEAEPVGALVLEPKAKGKK